MVILTRSALDPQGPLPEISSEVVEPSQNFPLRRLMVYVSRHRGEQFLN